MANNLDAWFTIATTDGETFQTSKTDDLLIYTSAISQSVFVGGGNVPYIKLTPTRATLYTGSLVMGLSNNVIVTDNGITLNGATSLNFSSNFSISSSGIAGSNLIGTAHIADGSITQTKLAPTIALSNYAPQSITEDKLATNSVSNRALSNASITGDKFASDRMYINNFVVSEKAQNSAVYIGYSNTTFISNNTYALSQTASGETTVNSGGSNSIRFGISGTEVMRLTNGGNIELSGIITQLSDLNQKYDLRPIQSALSKVNQLTGYTYKFRNRPPQYAESAGLIAQEVQAVLPEAVRKSSTNETLQLDYSSVSCLYVEAIKDLHALVLSLQTQVSKLKDAIKKA